MIGIDPGTNTGVAVWDKREGKLIEVRTTSIHKALFDVEFSIQVFGDKGVLIRCENPNTWKPHKGTDRHDVSKLQGAGSIKRDFAIWRDFAKDLGIDFEGVNLHSSLKKLSDYNFRRMTGWDMRTSEHARDAAMLCFGY